jgi:excisionase family DNA binding protein
MEMSTASTPQESPEAPRFHSVSAAARILGVSPMTLYRLIAEGEFPAIRIRSRLVVPARAIQEMADAAMAGQSVVDTADWPGRQAAET